MKNKAEEIEIRKIDEVRAESDKIFGSDTEAHLAEAKALRRELVNKVDDGILSAILATEEASETICNLLHSEDESIRLQAAKAIFEISLANKDDLLKLRRRF